MRKRILLPFISVVLLSACSSSVDDSEVIAETRYGEITKEEMYTIMKDHYGEKILSEQLYDQILSQDYTVTEEEIQKAFDDLKEEIGSTYQLVFEQIGLTSDEQIKDMLKTELLKQKAVFEDVEVTEEEVKDYYEDLVPEVKLSQIVVEDEAIANEIKQKLEDGTSFEELAEEYSTDSQSAPEGGNIGWFSLDGSDTELQKTLSSLDIEEVSAPIKEEDVYRILKITDRQAIKPFEEMKDEIADVIKASKVDPEDINKTLQEHINNADLKIKDKDLKDIFADLDDTN